MNEIKILLEELLEDVKEGTASKEELLEAMEEVKTKIDEYIN